MEEVDATLKPAALPQEEDRYARYIIPQAYPSLEIPLETAPTAHFLIASEGIGCLSLAVLNGDLTNVEKISDYLNDRINDEIPKQYQESNIPTHGMPILSQMLDQIDGLTPLHLVGHYLMTRWDKEAIYGVRGTDYKEYLKLCAKNMIMALRGLFVKDPRQVYPNNDNVSLKDIKDRDGQTAKEYFERVLIPKAPHDLQAVLRQLCIELTIQD